MTKPIITITTEFTRIIRRCTQQMLDAAENGGYTIYCPSTGKPAVVGDVMSTAPATRVIASTDDGRTMEMVVRRHPESERNAEQSLRTQLLFGLDDEPENGVVGHTGNDREIVYESGRGYGVQPRDDNYIVWVATFRSALDAYDHPEKYRG